MTTPPYRVVLADDHVLVRHGLRRILEEVSDLEVVGEAGDGLEAIDLVRRFVPDLVVLDLAMPHLRGIEAIHEIRAIDSRVKVLVLTMHSDRKYVVAAMTAGAAGYLLKEDADRHLFAAVETVRRGDVYISPKLSSEVIEDWLRIRRGGPVPEDEERLTVREREVVKLIAEGRSSREIGELLGISARTVEHYRVSIMAKAKLKGIADIVKYAIARGYVQAGADDR